MGQSLPGEDLIERGTADLAREIESVEALLVSIARARLSRIGFSLPPGIPLPERRLYERLAREDADSAHARYNALIRRLVRFERAAECEPVDRERIERFFRELGTKARENVRAYLAGGATAVLFGWRSSTIDIDLKMVPDSDPLLRALPDIKEDLRINVELASPDQFIPELPGWQGRSPFIVAEGSISFHHYDLYSQALAKVERGHPQDAEDAAEMVRRGLVSPADVLRLFGEIEPKLYRYPAIDSRSFRRAVEDFVEEFSGPRDA